MEDLIKEEEFIKREYNPWPRFAKFYALSFVLFWIIYFANVTLNFSFVITSIILILIVTPIAGSTVMILGAKAYTSIKNRKIISVLGLFYLLYMLNIFALAIKSTIKKGMDEDFIYGATAIVLLYAVILAIMSLIILAIMKKRRKKIMLFNDNDQKPL